MSLNDVVTSEGNNGVFINVQNNTRYRATWAAGPEYQLLYNTNNLMQWDGLNDLQFIEHKDFL
jgi:hypothetical protein